MIISKFQKYLIEQNLSKNTICSYLQTINDFKKLFSTIQKNNLLLYKAKLIEKYKPKSVNLKIQGINKYLEFLNLSELKLNFIKIQQKTFIENIISDSDYLFFKNQLKKDKNFTWYFVVRFLAATGARVSELIQIKVEDVKKGYIDLYTKGGKIRRIYIPKKLQIEATEWLNNINLHSGYIFLNKNKKQLTTRGIAHQLKELAKKYKLNLSVIYPHSFRHRFAKNFLSKNNDIALLADLMGHESIETTRIYLRKTSQEQKEIVDKVVDW